MRRIFTLFIVLCTCRLSLVAQINCDFTASVIYGCPPLQVNFYDQSTGGPTSFYWDFDNGNTSTFKDASVTFATPGIFNVLHVASNGSASDTQIMQIRVFQPPAVNFAAPDNHGCISPCHTVHFTNLTVPGESPVSQYVWNFGDATSAQTGYNVNHCYNQAGSFAVTLVARDSNGCQTSKVVPGYVVIGQAPVSSLTATPTQSCTSPRLVSFTGSGSSSNGAVTYEWYFGNGNTSAQQNPSTTYTTGIYNPILIVSDPLGCQDTAFGHIEITDLRAGFTAATQNACSGIPVQFTDTSNFASSWSWNFGDGGTSTQQNPTHTYAATGTYTVTLTIGYNGCTDTRTQTAYIRVTAPINFTFGGSPTGSCSVPLVTDFTSNAPGATSYLWEFGDGNTSNQPNPSYIYNTEGSYSVSLSVTNTSGCVNKQTKSNYINIGFPQAQFTFDSLHGCAPLTNKFTDLSTPAGSITSYQWQFGDGDTSTQANPTHVYTAMGDYVPILIIENAAGCRDTIVSADTIKVGSALVPDFTATPLVQCVNQPVSFTNFTQGGDANTVYIWQFGDGQISNLENPVHVYSDTGYYNVTLTVINHGCRSDSVKNRYIQIVVPKAQFGFNFDCNNTTNITFSDSSQGADTWFWDFGDGATSTQQNPTHTYPTADNYTITLIVTNRTTGCVDSSKRSLSTGKPKAAFGSNIISGCYPLAVHFIDSSVLATGWKWFFGDGDSSALAAPNHVYQDTGQYTVTLIINPTSGCSDTLVKINYITVYGIRGKLKVAPNQGCTPLKVSFSDSLSSYQGTIASRLWNFGTGDTSSLANPVYTYDAQAVFMASLKVTDSHGCNATLYQNIDVKDVKAAFISDTIVCPGASAHFTNQSQSSNAYQWDFGDGTKSTLINPGHTYYTSGSYTVTLVSINTVYGCSDTFVRPYYVNVDTPKPDFYVLSNFAPCPPFPVQFYNTTTRPGLQWKWYYGDGDTGTDEEPLHVYFFPGDYDVTLVAIDSNGCSGSVTYEDLISVRGPIGNFTVTPDTGCVPLTVSISGSVLSTVSIDIDLGDGSGAEDTLSIVHTYTIPGTYIPTFRLTDSLGCHVAYPADTVLVGLIPYPGLPEDTTVCKGNYVQFNLPYGDRFEWKSNQSDTYLSCDDCKSPVSTSPDTIIYYVTATTNVGCVAKDTITVNVDALPLIFPGISFRICPDDTLQLKAGPHVSSAVWSPNSYISDTNAVSPRVWPPDTTTYRVTGTNNTGCSVSRIVKVFPITKVVSDISVHDTLLCEGGTVPLEVSVQEASYNDTSFLWSPTQYLNSPYIQNPTLSAPPGDYTYTIIVKSTTCIADTEQVHVRIEPSPTLEAGDEQTVTKGTNIQLWAASHESVNYYWAPQVDSFSCTACRRPYVTVTESQTVYVTAENEYGCKTTDSVSIEVISCNLDMIFVPNTFTPNNDGVNDRLYVRGKGLRELEYFRVFDRWGSVVWETHNLDEGWDGTIKGKPADMAAYVYILKGVCSSGSTAEKSGNVTLIR